MASWQFDCVLVPRASMEVVSTDGRRLLREGSEDAWRGHSLGALRRELEGLGTAVPSWTPEIVMWGETDATCLELGSRNGAIDELRLRVDLRSPEDDLFLGRVLRIARKRDLLLVTERGDIIEPLFEWLMRCARSSSAAAFVRDPDAYLESLAMGSIESGHEVQLSSDLLAELRDRARRGEQPCALAKLIGRRLGAETASRMQAIRYFREAFGLTLKEAMAIGAAPVFEPDGPRSVADIDAEIMESWNKHRATWDPDGV